MRCVCGSRKCGSACAAKTRAGSAPSARSRSRTRSSSGTSSSLRATTACSWPCRRESCATAAARCGEKNHLRARFCNQCGRHLDENRHQRYAQGNGTPRLKLHADIAHPIHADLRSSLERQVILSYQEEVRRSREPGYVAHRLDGDDADFYDLPDAVRQVAPQDRAAIPSDGDDLATRGRTRKNRCSLHASAHSPSSGPPLPGRARSPYDRLDPRVRPLEATSPGQPAPPASQAGTGRRKPANPRSVKILRN